MGNPRTPYSAPFADSIDTMRDFWSVPVYNELLAVTTLAADREARESRAAPVLLVAMISPRRRSHWHWILLGAAALLAGCNTPAGDEGKKPAPQAQAQPQPQPKEAPSVWTPDAALAGKLTQTGKFAKYQISLPADFTSLDMSEAPGSWSWYGPGTPPTAIFVLVSADKGLVQEAEKNMRQALVNFSTALVEQMGIAISERDKTETGTLDGIAFARFKWSGATQAQARVSGFAYGALDNGSAITFTAMNLGADTEAADRLIETILATFRKQ